MEGRPNETENTTGQMYSETLLARELHNSNFSQAAVVGGYGYSNMDGLQGMGTQI
jgi:hypothetical protein